MNFINPSYLIAAGGLFLVAAPIIIHLINRIRFRRVEFAAMEFLLQSQQKNRRRILLEQLLLLLLRILIVLAIVAIIARMILDSGKIAMFGGPMSHHLVLVDDSGSMQDQAGEKTAFEQALKTAQNLVKQGSRQEGGNEFSFVLLSNPDQVVSDFAQRKMDDALVSDLETVFGNLQCTHQSFNLIDGLKAAHRRFTEQKSGAKFLHVVSDYRMRDWSSKRALAGAVSALEADGVAVNFVKTVPDRHENLAITELTGQVQIATAGVPTRLSVKVKNLGEQDRKDVRLNLLLNGTKLPRTIPIELIKAGDTFQREFDMIFDSARQHQVRVELPTDTGFTQDNSRALAVDVTTGNKVLIIDGNPAVRSSDLSAGSASYLLDALSQGKTTVFDPDVQAVDFLRRRSLDPYQSIVLLNVTELPVDALQPVENFAAAGGGLIWYMGDAVNADFYNDKLYNDGKGIFPVRLARAPRTLPPSPEGVTNPDMKVGDHPVLGIFGGQDNPLIDAVHVNKYFPVAEDWEPDDQKRKDNVQTIATLRNGQPFMFDHAFGRGKIITVLTTSAPQWNTLAQIAPVFVIVQMETLMHVARTDRVLERRTVGEPIEFSLDPTNYTGKIIIVPPGNVGEAALGARPETKAGEPESTRLTARFNDTDRPGVYRVTLMTSAGEPETKLIAYNLSIEESELELIATDEMKRRLGNDVQASVQEASADGSSGDWLRLAGRTVDQDVRLWLIVFLVVALVLEQALAYRLSYHPTTAGSTV